MIGNPLAALGCWMEGATLHIGKVPKAAGAQPEGSTNVGCMFECGEHTRGVGSCPEASPQPVSVPTEPGLPLDGCLAGRARGTPRGPRGGHMASIEVEPTFLARVADATWQNADVEMRKLARRARGSHAQFHVR